MKIEVLYFAGCPNHGPAVERVQEILEEEGISAGISEVKVQGFSTAKEIGFLGSPSIRINDLDVEQAARSEQEYGMMCRTYLVDGRREGLPSREMIRYTIREVQSGIKISDGGQNPVPESKRASLLATGSIVAAIMASFCCIPPILFALTGVSMLGASATFAAWRPYLLGATFGLLALGFYFAYRPAKESCAPGSACAIPATKRSGRWMLWVASGVVVFFGAFPFLLGLGRRISSVSILGWSRVATEASY